jgi:hypothetical protein
VRDGGEIVALVSAGITVDSIGGRLRGQVAALAAVAGGALALGAWAPTWSTPGCGATPAA